MKSLCADFHPHKLGDEKSQRTNNIPTPQISFRASIHPAKGCRIGKVKRCRLPKLPPMQPQECNDYLPCYALSIVYRMA